MTRELPDYANVTSEELAEACRAALRDCDARIAALIAIPPGQRTFENTVLAAEEARAAVKQARAAWGLLAEVSPDRALREAAQKWAGRLDKRAVGIGLDEQVFRAVRDYANGTQAAALTGVDARLLGDLQRDYQRSGIGLPAAQRERLRLLFDELVELGSGFTATLAGWRDGIVVDRDELDGLPEAFIEGLERAGDGYRVSLDNPQFWPFMCEARSAERRRELLEKDLRRGGAENVARLERALAVRREIAEMLGYSCWAAYVLETRMAKTPEAVARFLDDLRSRVTAKADADEEAGGSREMTQWEQPYAISRLKQMRYAFDEMEIAQYLPLEACLQGLFATTETEIDFVEAPSQMLEHWCWEPAVVGGFARHHRTGEPLPERLLDALATAKTAASGVLTMWQLAFATLDAAYHSAGYAGESTATYAEVYARHGLAYVEGTHLQSGITHLFGYDAAYYSYLWSKVLGDDMYTRFQEAGPLDPATGAHYRRTVLERGGAVDGAAMVRDFLGRDPSNDAFLREIGLSTSPRA